MAAGRPLVYTYRKAVAIPTSAVNRRDMKPACSTSRQLEALERCPTSYDSVAALTRRHFGGQRWRSWRRKGFCGWQWAKVSYRQARPANRWAGRRHRVSGDNHGTINTGRASARRRRFLRRHGQRDRHERIACWP